MTTKITNGAIDPKTITGDKIADASITSLQIGVGAITTLNILDSSITAAKIADRTITKQQMQLQPQGSIGVYSSAGEFVPLAPGLAKQVLLSGGPNADNAWGTLDTGLGCQLGFNANTNIPANSWASVQWQRVIYDDNNFYNSSFPSRLTINASGRYSLVFCSGVVYGGNGPHGVRFFRNGDSFNGGIYPTNSFYLAAAGANGNINLNISYIADLAAGDYVEAQLYAYYQNQSVSAVIASNMGFSITKIR